MGSWRDAGHGGARRAVVELASAKGHGRPEDDVRTETKRTKLLLKGCGHMASPLNRRSWKVRDNCATAAGAARSGRTAKFSSKRPLLSGARAAPGDPCTLAIRPIATLPAGRQLEPLPPLTPRTVPVRRRGRRLRGAGGEGAD